MVPWLMPTLDLWLMPILDPRLMLILLLWPMPLLPWPLLQLGPFWVWPAHVVLVLALVWLVLAVAMPKLSLLPLPPLCWQVLTVSLPIPMLLPLVRHRVSDRRCSSPSVDLL
jgi:hypothetical protein